MSVKKDYIITKIGNYYIGQSIKEIPNLKELTDEEYRVMNAGVKKMLKDEIICDAEDVDFQGERWNTVLTFTDDKVYNIAIQFFGQNKEKTKELFKKVLKFLEDEMGKCNEYFSTPNMTANWFKPNGNVALGQKDMAGFFATHLIISGDIKLKKEDIEKLEAWQKGYKKTMRKEYPPFYKNINFWIGLILLLTGIIVGGTVGIIIYSIGLLYCVWNMIRTINRRDVISWIWLIVFIFWMLFVMLWRFTEIL